MTRPDPSAFLKSAVAFIVAHMIILRGRDISLPRVVEDKSYAVSALLCFGIVMLTWIMIDRISSYFNVRFDWMERPGERFILQSLASVITPVLLMATFCGFVAWLLYGTSVLNKVFVIHQLVVAVSFVVLINFLHFLRYLINRMRETQRILKRDFPYFSNLRF